MMLQQCNDLFNVGFNGFLDTLDDIAGAGGGPLIKLQI